MKGDKIFELTIEGNQKIIGYRKNAEKNQKDFAGNVLEYDNESFDGILKTPLDFKNDFKNDLKHE